MNLAKMDLKNVITNHPIELRNMITNPQIMKALGDIGILPRILELHAPSIDSRKNTGCGRTLCGIKGTRHPKVTCKKCLKKIKKVKTRTS